MMDVKLTHIKEIETHNSGGNCMIDLLHLNDGRVIGVSSDCIVVYDSIDHFMNNVDEEHPSLDLY